MIMTEHHLEFLSLKGGYTGLSESTLVKMLHCWKSHVTAQLYIVTGELHVPLEVCGAVVKRELDYWQINENHIKSCCWRTYRSYIENKRILDSFNRSILREHRKVDLDGLVGWKRFQTQVWMFLEYPRTSRAAMVSNLNA